MHAKSNDELLAYHFSRKENVSSRVNIFECESEMNLPELYDFFIIFYIVWSCNPRNMHKKYMNVLTK